MHARRRLVTLNLQCSDTLTVLQKSTVAVFFFVVFCIATVSRLS